MAKKHSELLAPTAYSYRLPELVLTRHNLFRERPVSQIPVRGVWPTSANTLVKALAPFRISLKPLDFFVPYQRFHMFPYPTHGGFFRIQTFLWIYWHQFNLRQYCVILDFGSKQKKLFKESVLWLRQSRTKAQSYRSFWPFIQRTSSYTFLNNSVFQLNSNNNPLYFSFVSPNSSTYWFEELLPNLRLSGWNYYSRLQTLSMETLLSQSMFDSSIFQRKSPWSPKTLWLASPIHDSSAFISRLFSIDSFVLPEIFFQFCKRQRLFKLKWSQLFLFFWKGFSERSWSWKQISYFFSYASSFPFYFKCRSFFKMDVKFSQTIFELYSLAYPLFLKFSLPVILFPQSSTIQYQVHFTPSIVTKEFVNRKTVVNCLALFPQKKLYTNYFRRAFVHRSAFVSSKLTLESPIRDLNFFLSFFFQSFLFNQTMKLSQLLLLWLFFFKQDQYYVPEPQPFGLLTPRAATKKKYASPLK